MSGGDFQGRGDNGLRPAGSQLEILGTDDLSTGHFQDEHRRGCDALGGIAVLGIVEHSQLGQKRKEADQIFPAQVPAAADVGLGNVVPAVSDARAHAGEVQVHAGQSGIPNKNLDSRCGGGGQHAGDRLAAEGGLKRKIQILGDRLFQKRAAQLPRVGIGGRKIEVPVKGENLSRRFVRIVVIGVLGAEHGAANAAFSGAVDSGQHVDRHGDLFPLPGGGHRGPAKFSRLRLEGFRQAALGLGRLHAGQQRVEFLGELIQSRAARADQFLKALDRDENRLGLLVPRDGDGALGDHPVPDAGEGVFDVGRRNRGQLGNGG